MISGHTYRARSVRDRASSLRLAGPMTVAVGFFDAVAENPAAAPDEV